jgi:hypothetical protein
VLAVDDAQLGAVGVVPQHDDQVPAVRGEGRTGEVAVGDWRDRRTLALDPATVAFILDVYGHVLPGMDADVANLVASMVLGEPLSPSVVDAEVSTNEIGPPTVIGDPFVDKTVDNWPNGPSKRGGDDHPPCSEVVAGGGFEPPTSGL